MPQELVIDKTAMGLRGVVVQWAALQELEEGKKVRPRLRVGGGGKRLLQKISDMHQLREDFPGSCSASRAPRMISCSKYIMTG